MTLLSHQKTRHFLLPTMVFILLGMTCPLIASAAKISIKGVGGELKDNVEAFLDAVPVPASDSLDSYREQLRKSAVEALQALGYYEPKISVNVTGQGKKLAADVGISVGRPIRLESFVLDIQGEAQQDATFNQLIAEQEPQQGDIFHHGHYSQFKAALSNLALSRGYFDAKWQSAKVELSIKKLRAEAALVFDSGVRHRFGEISVTGVPQLNELILATRPFETGDYYLAEKIAEYNADLGDSNFFRSVLVHPVLDERIDGVVPVAIQAIPKADNIVSVGGGYSTDVGLRVKLRWTLPRINKAGHSVVSRFDVSDPEKNISFSYKVPLEDAINNFALVQYAFQEKDYEDTLSRKNVLTVRRQWQLPSKWIRALYLRFEHEDFIQGPQQNTTKLLLPGISFARDRTKGGLNVHWGNRYQFYLEVSNTVWGSDVDLAKFRGLGKWVRTAGENRQHKLIVRGDLGAILVDNVFEVPASLRFFYRWRSIDPGLQF